MRQSLIILISIVSPACLLDIDTSRIGAGSASEGDGGDTHEDASTQLDASFDAGFGDAGVIDACPATMVAVPGAMPRTCIDRLEVSVREYQVFLVTGRNSINDGCRWNNQLEPRTWPQALVDAPVVDLDWCDALSYCDSVGKRLCSNAEWTLACSANGTRVYPYGDSFQWNMCHVDTDDGDDDENSELHATGAHPSCEGGVAGLFDMSGNAAEWTFDCQPGNGGTAQRYLCDVRGGSHRDGPAELACAATRTEERASSATDRGFRCCQVAP